MAEAPASKKVQPLTIRERIFMSELFRNGMNQTAAYEAMMVSLGKPMPEKSTAEKQGWRMRRRICERSDFKAILAERGIDQVTLADDLNRLRTIKRPAFSRDGELVGEFDDGQTQLGAAKLIGDALDAINQKTSVELTGNLSIGLPPPPPAPDPTEAPGA